mgnify:CR=1 FL=1
MFNNAIVRKPGKCLVNGLTSANLGAPDYSKAILQHRDYCNALASCGVEVTILVADEAYPDSTFIEDTALLTPRCAIMTNPGAPSRQGEVGSIKSTVEQFYSTIENIQSPGTVEAGDIMMVGNHFYIGISARTNDNGATQLAEILKKYDHSSSTIPLNTMLHLKTGLSYLENNNLLICGEFLSEPAFNSFNKVIIPESESYAANCIWVNDTVLVPRGYPITRQCVMDLGYTVVDLEMSEFQKLDGGLSCLSLRF